MYLFEIPIKSYAYLAKFMYVDEFKVPTPVTHLLYNKFIFITNMNLEPNTYKKAITSSNRDKWLKSMNSKV